MDFNSNDYFTYKRNKIQKEVPRQKKRISKLNFLFQLFLATFIIMVIIILIAIMRFSSKVDKVDIEYSRNATAEFDKTNNLNPAVIEDTHQGKIDKRLILIQQEENAPSEAKIIAQNKQNNVVMDRKLIEDNEKIDKTYIKEFKEKQQLKQQEKEKQKEKEKQQARLPHKKTENEQTTDSQNNESNSKTTLDNQQNQKNDSTKHQTISSQNNQTTSSNSNVIIMSKVLIGRYRTLEDAQAMQNTIKAANPSLTPYVKKVGNVFSIQMGSYQDFTVARKYAQKLQAKGYEVWIYQQ